METSGMADVVAVRTWLNHGSSNPVGMKDIAEFWKACTAQEKAQFGNEARVLLAAV